MSTMKRSISAAAAAFMALTSVACTEREAPKTPLGNAPQGPANQSAHVASISGEAKRALDSGNVLFRAKSYELALAQYSRSAELAPTEMAPLLGILMVADVTGDTRLADATLPKLRRLDPGVADSTVVKPHKKIMEGHPRLTAPTPAAPTT